MSVADAAALHAELFADFPEPVVKKVSRLEREAKELANRSLVYGEIPFATVDAVFQLVRATEVGNNPVEYPRNANERVGKQLRNDFGVLLDKGGNFYDLGSGCGKVVRSLSPSFEAVCIFHLSCLVQIMAAALLHDFSKCCGIEVITYFGANDDPR